MYNFLNEKGTAAAFITGVVIIAVFLISAIMGINGAGYDVGTDLVPIGKTEGFEDMNFFNLGISLTLLLIALAVLGMIGFGILELIKFPKKGMRAVILFVGLIVLFFILRAVAPADMGARMTALKEDFSISEGVSGLISGGILTTLCLIGTAAVAMIYFEIRNAFK